MEYLRLKRDVLELVYLWVEDYKKSSNLERGIKQ